MFYFVSQFVKVNIWAALFLNYYDIILLVCTSLHLFLFLRPGYRYKIVRVHALLIFLLGESI